MSCESGEKNSNFTLTLDAILNRQRGLLSGRKGLALATFPSFFILFKEKETKLLWALSGATDSTELYNFSVLHLFQAQKRQRETKWRPKTVTWFRRDSFVRLISRFGFSRPCARRRSPCVPGILHAAFRLACEARGAGPRSRSVVTATPLILVC